MYSCFLFIWTSMSLFLIDFAVGSLLKKNFNIYFCHSHSTPSWNSLIICTLTWRFPLFHNLTPLIKKLTTKKDLKIIYILFIYDILYDLYFKLVFFVPLSMFRVLLFQRVLVTTSVSEFSLVSCFLYNLCLLVFYSHRCLKNSLCSFLDHSHRNPLIYSTHNHCDSRAPLLLPCPSYKSNIVIRL